MKTPVLQMGGLAVVRRRTVPTVGSVFAVFAFFLLAVFAGLVAAVGGVKVAVLFGGALMGLALFAVPAGWLMLALVVLSFFIVGQVFYFAGFGQALWLPYGFGLVLFGKWLVLKLRQQRGAFIGILDALAASSIIAVVVSIAVNQPNVLQALAGGKSLIMLWSVFLVVAAGLVSFADTKRIWTVLLWALFFQLPVVLYQFIVVAPSRTKFGATEGGVEWDAVVGGFGGDPQGGGASGAMACFVIVMAAYAVARYRRGLARLPFAMIAVLVALVCVGLGEVKIVVLLVPIAGITMFAPEIRKRPLTAVFGAISALIIGFTVLFAYQSIHYHSNASVSDPVKVIDRAFGYSLDPKQINLQTGEMGRVAAVVHWWNEVLLRDPFHSVFGYGPGASRGRSIVGAGEVARRYPFLIDRSAATQMLWDIGLFGFFSYLFALLAGAWQAVVLARRPFTPPSAAAVLDATAAGLAMMSLMLFYGRDPLEVPALSVLTMLMLGFVARSQREAGTPQSRIDALGCTERPIHAGG